LIQLSPRGQITLPSELRKQLMLRAGDAFQVRIEDGRIVLEPVEVTPVKLYTEAREQEFRENSDLKDPLSRWWSQYVSDLLVGPAKLNELQGRQVNLMTLNLVLEQSIREPALKELVQQSLKRVFVELF
jgi:AbrB family looped-hinge helix DNA binding protein